MLKFTDQENKVINFLYNKCKGVSGTQVEWKELAQFTSDPAGVKTKTLKRIVSEIKRKYGKEGKFPPFDVQFVESIKSNPITNKEEQMQISKKETSTVTAQNLVHVKSMSDGNLKVIEDSPMVAVVTSTPLRSMFKAERYRRGVTTKQHGFVQLGEREWEVFAYLDQNVGRKISLTELKDNVVYPKYGSKTPPRWYDSIMNTVNNIRRQVPGIKKNIFTLKEPGEETCYLYDVK